MNKIRRILLSMIALGLVSVSAWSAPSREVCRNSSGGIWAPPPLFPYDFDCLYLIGLKEVPESASCAAPELKDIYPTFNGHLGDLVTTTPLPSRPSERRGLLSSVAQEWKSESSQGVDLEAHAIRAGHCHKKTPSRVREVFLEGFDAPAGISNLWNEDYLRYKWEPQLARLRQEKSPIDYPALYDLNLEASGLWKRMVNCFDGNADLAREAYFFASFTCTDLAIDGKQLRQEVGSYLGRVRDFFITAHIEAPELLAKTRLDLADRLMKNQSVITQPVMTAPSLHPLFTQAALQFLIDITPIGKPSSMNKWMKNLATRYPNMDLRAVLSIGQLFMIIPDVDVNPLGLWPSAGRSAYQAVTSRALRLLYEVTGYFNMSKVKPIKVQPVGYADLRLPDIYSYEDTEITLEMAAITRRFVLPEKVPVKCSPDTGALKRVFLGCDS